MQNPSIVGVAVAFVCCSALTGCHKGTTVGPEGGGEGLRNYFENMLASTTQHFSVDATNGGSVIGAKGVRINFPMNAFRTQSGGSVTGPVSISLVEVLDIADMIMLNITTVGNDHGTLRNLKSGGAVFVTAHQGNNELLLGPQGMRISVPTSDFDPNMGVFTANRTAGEDLVWEEEDSTAVDSTWIELPTGGVSLGYMIQTDSLQWINCDYFPYSANNTTITATTPNDVPNDSTLVWFVFPGMNSVCYTITTAPHNHEFGQVPVGLPAVAVSLTRDGGVYRSAFTSFTTATNGNVGLSYQATTIQAFEAAINAL
ncbi:MAG: hypothetical protein JNL43_04215 [Flavobacteriales bacterium]|nr:hypothetical protein [Flavobacteriales bacterium]